MTRSRLRPGYSVSSRSRVVSSVSRSGYGNPLVPRSRASSEYYTPLPKASSGYYDSAAFDYAMDDTLSRSNYISSAAIDDFYDTSARSRGKDRRLLDETTTAIVSSETHTSPRAAVASLRARSRVPVAGSTGPARSSYQVKSSTLSSSSYPIVPQVAAGAKQQQLASSAPTVIRARVRGIPGMVILPRARAILSARRAADLASYYRAVSPFRFYDALDDPAPSADDGRVVAASYRDTATMLARPRRAPVARITPFPSPILADYAKAHVMADRAIGSSRPRVRVADLSYRRLALAPRYRKHAVHYYPGRSLVVPKRAHHYYYAAAPAAYVKSFWPRPPSRKLPGKASRQQVTPKSMYARVVRAVLFGEPMPGAEDPLPDLPFLSRMSRLPLPAGVKTRLLASLTPRRGYVPLPYFPFYPRYPHVYRPLFPLLYRSALPLSYPPRVIPSTTALALLLHLRDMQEPPPPPPRRSRKGKTSSARVRPKSRSKSKKAAIVASKLEMEEPRRRRPRSKFAADKLRSVRLESLETQGRANYPASVPQNTYGLRASKPPLRRQ